LVAALVIPGTPEDEQDESFVFGELAEKEARFGTGAGLEDEDIIVDDELEAEGREVVGKVALVVSAGEAEEVAAGAGIAEDDAAAEECGKDFAKRGAVFRRDVRPEAGPEGIGCGFAHD